MSMIINNTISFRTTSKDNHTHHTHHNNDTVALATLTEEERRALECNIDNIDTIDSIGRLDSIESTEEKSHKIEPVERIVIDNIATLRSIDIIDSVDTYEGNEDGDRTPTKTNQSPNPYSKIKLPSSGLAKRSNCKTDPASNHTATRTANHTTINNNNHTTNNYTTTPTNQTITNSSIMASQHTYSVTSPTNVLPLRPTIKDYAWGIRGLDSRVARFALESGIIDEVDPDCPYAELWIGTHPSGPTTLRDGTTLESVVGGQLPFLFKVLSAGKALSIQAHPCKERAKKLNASNPKNYVDDNHKPELAVALTPFEAMCGFRRLEEIAILIKKHPEFAKCISDEAKLSVFLAREEGDKKEALQRLFQSFMSCDKETTSSQLKLLLKRLQKEQSAHYVHPHEEPPWERKCARAILRLAQQFPNDPGAMAPFFLNYLLIAPGESFYMAANEPHAYVAGEIIECMACSDNVVRAGLTPKFKDVDNLVEMLTYSMGGPTINAGTPAYGDGRIMRYTPPTGEFEVMIITCNPGEDITLPQLSVPSIFIVIEGSGNTDNEDGQRLVMRPGRSYYLPPNCAPLNLAVNENKRGPLRVALAHENMHLGRPTLRSAEDVPLGMKEWSGEFALPPEERSIGSAPNTPRNLASSMGRMQLNGSLEHYDVPKL